MQGEAQKGLEAALIQSSCTVKCKRLLVFLDNRHKSLRIHDELDRIRFISFKITISVLVMVMVSGR